jgi:hypothetical protein
MLADNTPYSRGEGTKMDGQRLIAFTRDGTVVLLKRRALEHQLLEVDTARAS